MQTINDQSLCETALQRLDVARRVEQAAAALGAVTHIEAPDADVHLVTVVGPDGLTLKLTLSGLHPRAVRALWQMSDSQTGILSHECFSAPVNVDGDCRSAQSSHFSLDALLNAVRNGFTKASNGDAYGDPAQPKCYVVNLSHQNRGQPYITVWRPHNSGYAYPLSWAGRYAKDKVLRNLSYYNSGSCNVAVPCEVLDALSVSPEPGYIDNDAGPVVPNTRANWKAVLAAVIATPAHPPKPQLKREMKAKQPIAA